MLTFFKAIFGAKVDLPNGTGWTKKVFELIETSVISI